ncbi:MAG TPA: F0F1 ATP synthase subunit gamma, partial [Acidimicrobiales bacterium]|nr:F0F1 ATP synthase subunit gamma [Acidimicrobiales bacterium]
MAGGQERVLRRRIRSVQSTKKITRAMELIAASQIVRAQNRIVANRPYRRGMAHIVSQAAREDPRAAEKLLGTPRSPKAVGIIAIVGDRGLCGAYNSLVFRATERLAAEHSAAGRPVRLFTLGKKAPPHFRYRAMEVERSFVGFNDRPTFANAREVAAAASAPFLAGEIELVMLVSTRFISAGVQSVSTEQLLPLPEPETPETRRVQSAGRSGYIEFEPDAEKLLAEL